MAHEVRLEVYTLKVRKQRDDLAVRLDTFLDTTDFLDFFRVYIKSFDNKLSINESQQKSIQFKESSVRVLSEQRIISGVIESGDYGIESNIVNINTGTIKYHKTNEDADIKPFYFLFHLPRESDKAFVILQRIGIYGINGVFKNHLEAFFKQRYDQYLIELSPFVSRQLAKSFIENGAIRELTLRRYNLPSDITDKLGLVGHSEDILSVELRITAKQKHSLPYNTKVQKFIKNRNVAMFDLKELRNLGFDGEHKSSIKVTLGKNTRTVDLSETGQIRPYYDINAEVEKDSTGHPIFESINQIAIGLINDLISEIKK